MAKYEIKDGVCVISKRTKTIANKAFLDCKELISIEIPNSVTKIGYSAFEGCTNLTSIVIPESVTEISECTFRNCTALQHVEIPNSVVSIGYAAFEGCTALTSIIIPDSVERIEGPCVGIHPEASREKGAFAGCTGLTSINLAKIKILGDLTFYQCTALKEIILPDTLEFVGRYVFSDCTSLEEITIPSSIKSFGNSRPNEYTRNPFQGNPFSGCTALKSISMDGSLADGIKFWDSFYSGIKYYEEIEPLIVRR